MYKFKNGQKLEPFEEVITDFNEEHVARRISDQSSLSPSHKWFINMSPNLIRLRFYCTQEIKWW